MQPCTQLNKDNKFQPALLVQCVLEMDQTLKSQKSRKSGPWLVGVGAVMVVLGLSLSIGIRAWGNSRTWMLLQLPVILAPGHIQTPEFSTNIEEDFWVELDADRQTPSQIADKVLGIGDPLSMRFDQSHGFRLGWTLSCEGKTIKSGTSDGNNEGYWSDRIGRRLGWFRGERSKRYRIDVDVLEDGTQLQPYHPRLLVQIDLFTLDGYAMAVGFWSFIGLVILVVGGTLFLIGGVRIWLKRPIWRHATTL